MKLEFSVGKEQRVDAARDIVSVKRVTVRIEDGTLSSSLSNDNGNADARIDRKH